ncbi:endo-1,4-beta-xylanase xylA, putative (macronuclear) [Tetrahymena thermophila SB210]|uniref:Endo-1,4-beta-xylanase xylA, putative n=1 Tax=Tetrahymena thermophila (strain SB210) TaxID=312017 RepID=I7M228_TETTS|nr:endo-1,4-beta-xylanase xylA, putative [Tetrahymena thermophila SB210]EAR98367.1 endo-1,4-beta-xylanase xylA, putative [Tetrahymena thermophila SB210]|eukprot:XP_001018612.1 endo-1,4-beta-xylanase xylA, putative [Tetrahymena thermophila SB210]
MNRFSLEFQNRYLEKQYQKRVSNQNSRLLRKILLGYFVFYVIPEIAEASMNQDYNSIDSNEVLSIIGYLILLVCYLGLTKKKDFFNFICLIAHIAILLTSMLGMIKHTKQNNKFIQGASCEAQAVWLIQNTFQYSAIQVGFHFIISLISSTIKIALTSVTIVYTTIIIYIIVIVEEGSKTSKFSIVMIIFFAFIICEMYFIHYNHKMRRQNFLHQFNDKQFTNILKNGLNQNIFFVSYNQTLNNIDIWFSNKSCERYFSSQNKGEFKKFTRSVYLQEQTSSKSEEFYPDQNGIQEGKVKSKQQENQYDNITDELSLEQKKKSLQASSKDKNAKLENVIIELIKSQIKKQKHKNYYDFSQFKKYLAIQKEDEVEIVSKNVKNQNAQPKKKPTKEKLFQFKINTFIRNSCFNSCVIFNEEEWDKYNGLYKDKCSLQMQKQQDFIQMLQPVIQKMEPFSYLHESLVACINQSTTLLNNMLLYNFIVQNKFENKQITLPDFLTDFSLTEMLEYIKISNQTFFPIKYDVLINGESSRENIIFHSNQKRVAQIIQNFILEIERFVKSYRKNNHIQNININAQQIKGVNSKSNIIKFTINFSLSENSYQSNQNFILLEENEEEDEDQDQTKLNNQKGNKLESNTNDNNYLQNMKQNQKNIYEFIQQKSLDDDDDDDNDQQERSLENLNEISNWNTIENKDDELNQKQVNKQNKEEPNKALKLNQNKNTKQGSSLFSLNIKKQAQSKSVNKKYKPQIRVLNNNDMQHSQEVLLLQNENDLEKVPSDDKNSLNAIATISNLKNNSDVNENQFYDNQKQKHTFITKNTDKETQYMPFISENNTRSTNKISCISNNNHNNNGGQLENQSINFQVFTQPSNQISNSNFNLDSKQIIQNQIEILNLKDQKDPQHISDVEQDQLMKVQNENNINIKVNNDCEDLQSYRDYEKNTDETHQNIIGYQFQNFTKQNIFQKDSTTNSSISKPSEQTTKTLKYLNQNQDSLQIPDSNKVNSNIFPAYNIGEESFSFQIPNCQTLNIQNQQQSLENQKSPLNNFGSNSIFSNRNISQNNQNTIQMTQSNAPNEVDVQKQNSYQLIKEIASIYSPQRQQTEQKDKNFQYNLVQFKDEDCKSSSNDQNKNAIESGESYQMNKRNTSHFAIIPSQQLGFKIEEKEQKIKILVNNSPQKQENNLYLNENPKKFNSNPQNINANDHKDLQQKKQQPDPVQTRISSFSHDTNPQSIYQRPSNNFFSKGNSFDIHRLTTTTATSKTINMTQSSKISPNQQKDQVKNIFFQQKLPSIENNQITSTKVQIKSNNIKISNAKNQDMKKQNSYSLPSQQQNAKNFQQSLIIPIQQSQAESRNLISPGQNSSQTNQSQSQTLLTFKQVYAEPIKIMKTFKPDQDLIYQRLNCLNLQVNAKLICALGPTNDIIINDKNEFSFYLYQDMRILHTNSEQFQNNYVQSFINFNDNSSPQSLKKSNTYQIKSQANYNFSKENKNQQLDSNSSYSNTSNQLGEVHINKIEISNLSPGKIFTQNKFVGSNTQL